MLQYLFISLLTFADVTISFDFTPYSSLLLLMLQYLFFSFALYIADVTIIFPFSSVDGPGADSHPELLQSQNGHDQWHILVHATKQVGAQYTNAVHLLSILRFTICLGCLVNFFTEHLNFK